MTTDIHLGETVPDHAVLRALALHHAATASSLAAVIAGIGGLTQLRLESRSLRSPPKDSRDGQCFAVPRAAIGDWDGHSGDLALRFGTGWIWLAPREGWRCWIADEGIVALHDGTAWRGGAMALASNGAGTFLRVSPLDVAIGSAPDQRQIGLLPAPALLLAVTARVVVPLEGTLTGWSLGVPGAIARFGSGFGCDEGSGPRRIAPRPMTLRRPRPLVLAAEGGTLQGGRILAAIHWLDVTGPSAPGV